MKNTIENKAKFFAQYWGQKILRWHQWIDSNEYSVVNFQVPMQSNIGIDNGWYIELKPLSQISDEDALILFNHVFPDCLKEVSNDERIETVKYEIPQVTYSVYKFLGLKESTRYIDKTRDLGYALPWNGITIEEQIEFGWVKLKNESL